MPRSGMGRPFSIRGGCANTRTQRGHGPRDQRALFDSSLSDDSFLTPSALLRDLRVTHDIDGGFSKYCNSRGQTYDNIHHHAEIYR